MSLHSPGTPKGARADRPRRLAAAAALILAATGTALLGRGRDRAEASPPAPAPRPSQSPARNVIIFVADGLRPGSINPTDSPTLDLIRRTGVNFANSHAIFPTFTTPNGSAIATGHYPGDTGDFSNTVFVGYQVAIPNPAGGFLANTATPFVENDPVIGDLDAHFPTPNGSFLNEDSLLQIARQHGYHTAAVGKVGPVLLQDAAAGTLAGGTVPPATVIVDDATGRAGGIPLNADVAARLVAAGLGTTAPTRGANGASGNNTTPGTLVPNTVQQKYFADATTLAILPSFRASGGPFALVYWSRDPDGTQHNQGDSLNSLVPGINGPTSKASVRNADNNLAQLLAYVNSDPALAHNTDIFVTADHGFATISKHDLDPTGTQSTTSYAASQTYVDNTNPSAPNRQEVNTGFLPPGFVAIDIAHALNLPLFDPDGQIPGASPAAYVPVDPTRAQQVNASNAIVRAQRPRSGNGLIGGTGLVPAGEGPVVDPKVVIASNGGSDLVYLPDHDVARLRTVVAFLASQDYVSGLFVDDSYGAIDGTLPTGAINLVGGTGVPRPAIVINFRTFALDPSNPLYTGVEVADTGLQHGQGMHGTFGRHDTFNTMVAIGPDFKQGFTDVNPVSNADITPTLAYVMGLPLAPKGPLVGRVATEALVGGPQRNYSTLGIGYSSTPAASGLRTYLSYQNVGGTRYFDAAGFAGRTIGLPVVAGTSGDDALAAGSAYLAVDGLAGNDTLSGGTGRVTLIGGAGADTFVLAPSFGTETVADYNHAEGDVLALSGGLTFAGLSIRQGTGGNAANALIYQARTGKLLALLVGVQASSLGSGDFVTR